MLVITQMRGIKIIMIIILETTVNRERKSEYMERNATSGTPSYTGYKRHVIKYDSFNTTPFYCRIKLLYMYETVNIWL